MKKYFGEGALLLNTIIWGGTFALIKNALTDISPLLFLGIRFIIAAAILFPFIYKIVKQTDRNTFIAGSVLGLFYFFGFATQTIGLNYTTATKSGFITGTFVVIIPILQTIIEKKKPKWYNIVSIIFVMIGLIFLSSSGDNLLQFINELGSDFNIGDFLTLICAVLFAFQVVYVDVFTKKYDYMPMVFIQLLITGIGGFLGSIFLSSIGLEIVKFNLTTNLIFALVYTSVFASIIATIIQLRYQKVVSPTKAGIIYSFEPIMAAILAFFIVGEKISKFGMFGGVFIVIGLLLSEFLENRNGQAGKSNDNS
ncbi:MAG: DMT family transporter [Ignavibacterium album]|uniref:DMT family transporter n=1 Tax=Ignavibacterium album TaxID=591197 RepID=UPI0026E9B81B|nr:DMT family transporter [Ignavibacterium album]MCX8107107.1 DMT family transporter [Ignavibacterium album]